MSSSSVRPDLIRCVSRRLEMPEGPYDVLASSSLIDGGGLRDIHLEVIGGVPFPKSGTEDRVYSIVLAARTINEALFELRDDILRDREPEGGMDWRPRVGPAYCGWDRVVMVSIEGVVDQPNLSPDILDRDLDAWLDRAKIRRLDTLCAVGRAAIVLVSHWLDRLGRFERVESSLREAGLKSAIIGAIPLFAVPGVGDPRMRQHGAVCAWLLGHRLVERYVVIESGDGSMIDALRVVHTNPNDGLTDAQVSSALRCLAESPGATA